MDELIDPRTESVQKFLTIEDSPKGNGMRCLVLRYKDRAIQLTNRPYLFDRGRLTATKILLAIIDEVNAQCVLDSISKPTDSGNPASGSESMLGGKS